MLELAGYLRVSVDTQLNRLAFLQSNIPQWTNFQGLLLFPEGIEY